MTNNNITGLAAEGNNIIAGTNGGGVFLSNNNGASWISINSDLPNDYIYSLAVRDSNIFVSTAIGVYLSTDNGASWTKSGSGLPFMNVTFFAFDDTDIFAGGFNGVFRSTDNGANWLPAGLRNDGILSLASNGTKLLAGNQTGEIYLSTNKGANWTGINRSLPYIPGVYSLAVSGNNLYAGNFFGVYSSTDDGANWSADTVGLPPGSRHIPTLLFKGNNLFAGIASNGIYKSTDLGKSWSLINDEVKDWDISLAVKDSILYAGSPGGVYFSADDGSNWTADTAGLNRSYVTALAVNGTDIFAGTYGNGVFISTNSGESWTERNSGLTDYDVLSLAVEGTNLFAGTMEGVYFSTDNGTKWSAASQGPIQVTSFAFDGNKVFAGSGIYGIYLSENNGKNWTRVVNGLTSYNVYSLIIKNGYLYAGTDDGVFRRPLEDMIADINAKKNNLPIDFSLHQNYPNPFNPVTKIEYSVPKLSFVALNVYDILGREVAALVNEEKSAGNYNVNFDGSNLSSGIYLYKIQAGNYSSVKKMILLK